MRDGVPIRSPNVTWRERARPIIERVLRETAGQPEKEIRCALRDAYPFGERAMYPYKAWCSEVRRQRGLERPKQRGVKVEPPDPRQLTLEVPE
jgi:hypothetical protein